MNAEFEPRLSSGGGRHEIYIKASHRDSETSDITHSHVWWFSPVLQTGPKNARLTPTRYLHKTYTDTCRPTEVSEEYDGEEIVESVGWADQDALGMADIPGRVIERLMDWFGRTIVERSVEYDGGTLPEYHYECCDCEATCEMPPRQTCPDCGSDALVEHID